MRRVSRWLLASAILVAACLLGVGSATATKAQTAGTDNESLSADSTLIRVDTAADGDATWEIQYQYYLTEAGEEEAFASYRQDVEENRSTYTDDFGADLRPTVRAAENETGREMALSNVTVTVRRQRLAQPTGIVTYSFGWSAFAGTDGSTLRIGDAIGGFYLGPDTRLTVTWPDGYEATSVTPEPDDRRSDRVAWDGELGFAATEPRVVAEESTDPDPDPAGAGGSPWLAVGLVGLLLAGLGASGVLYVRRRSTDDGAPPAVGPAAAETAAGDDDRPPAELLSDGERALAALDDSGGRMKQQELADACDWGDSKTSRVVSRLRDDGEIEVFRLGRENVIARPEETDD
ncbi:helix-turn-helix transcriptional regulator [Halorientalis halophila]|uniref:helix-turn-helix transcriptional regulator n=1 Tax=Halorientalis halophila TaxID=3108499 RepID=UPI00300866C0